MTLLPIVQRELRVAARKPSTWWVRMATSGLAMFASGSFLVIALVNTSSPTLGLTLFQILTWYCFGLCLLAGLFVTADALSEEKREGTLGLLFLTDLRGHDVVLGKFFARSLNAFYSLFALLPVLSISLLLGGVMSAEFARVSLALVNALFVSLAAGMLVSAHSHDHRQATGRTLFLLVVLVAGLPLAAWIGEEFKEASWLEYTAWLTPWTPFRRGFDASYTAAATHFWAGLVGSHLSGWLMLAWASAHLPRSWQVKASAKRQGGVFQAISNWLEKRRKETPAQRSHWLDANPVLWLNRRFLGSNVLLWLLALLWCVSMMAVAFLESETEAMLGVAFLFRPALFLFKLLVAIEACRFFAEARRTGAIELLLCSPLTNQQIRQGQWQALRQLYFLPMLLVITTGLCAFVWMVVTSPRLDDGGEWFTRLIFLLYPMLNLALDVYAAAHVGLWLSLTIKKPQYAAGYTILYTLVLPTLAFPVPDPVISLSLIAWAKGNFDGDIRWHIRRHFEPAVKVARGSAARKQAAPPPLPPITTA